MPTMAEWLASVGNPTSEAARDEAEQFRGENRLLPDPVIAKCYPKFYVLQRQIIQKPAGGTLDYRGTGICKCPQPVNLRGSVGLDLVIERSMMFVARFPRDRVTWPVVDTTSFRDCTVTGLRIPESNGAACGVLMARDDPTHDSNFNTLRRCDVRGAFGSSSEYGGACVINIGAEIFHWNEVNFRFGGLKGGAFDLSAYNEHRITSPYGPIAGSYAPGSGVAVSAAGGVIDGACHFGCGNKPEGCNPNDRYIFKIGSRVHSVFMREFWITAKEAETLRSAIVLGDAADNAELFTGVANVTIENFHNEAYAARYMAWLAGTTRGVRIRNFIGECGQPVGYESVHESRYSDGLTIDGMVPKPNDDYWANSPQPVQVVSPPVPALE